MQYLQITDRVVLTKNSKSVGRNNTSQSGYACKMNRHIYCTKVCIHRPVLYMSYYRLIRGFRSRTSFVTVHHLINITISTEVEREKERERESRVLPAPIWMTIYYLTKLICQLNLRQWRTRYYRSRVGNGTVYKQTGLQAYMINHIRCLLQMSWLQQSPIWSKSGQSNSRFIGRH